MMSWFCSFPWSNLLLICPQIILHLMWNIAPWPFLNIVVRSPTVYIFFLSQTFCLIASLLSFFVLKLSIQSRLFPSLIIFEVLSSDFDAELANTFLVYLQLIDQDIVISIAYIHMHAQQTNLYNKNIIKYIFWALQDFMQWLLYLIWWTKAYKRELN